MVTSVSKKVSPKRDESYEDFIIRAHSSLLDDIPDYEERNRYVWSAWEDANGEQPEQEVMRKRFSSGYKIEPNVCYFDEHELPTKDGGKYSVTVDKLADICRTNNLRIADVAAASPIIERHTVDPKDRELGKHAKDDHDDEPDILGYAGPYRLGMIGNVNPRFAIFADERHRLDKLSKLNARPRRSVEWVRFKNGVSYLDPIAALGGDSPRLLMPPAHYSAADSLDEAEVVRYSVAAPAYAGGSNTFVPTLGDEKRRYTSDDPQDGQEQDSMEVTENVVGQLVQAIQNTPEFQWVREQIVKQQQVEAAPPPMPGTEGNVPGQEPDGDELALGNDTPDVPGQAPAPAPSPVAGSPKFATSDQLKDKQDNPFAKAKEQYSAIAGGDVDVERFAAIQQANIERITSLESQLQTLARERSDAVRMQTLLEASGRFPAIDLEFEKSKVLYSAGSEMTDAQFQDHMQTVERYAARTGPTSTMIPDGVITEEVEVDKYAAEVSSEVMRLSNEYATRNEWKSYDELQAEAIKRIKSR